MKKSVNTFDSTGKVVHQLTLATLSKYHKMLLAGKDWQVAANEIAAGNESVYDLLAEASEPDKSCSCDACLKEFYPVEHDA
jgi:hypothetical protein